MLRFLIENGVSSGEVAHDGNPLLFKAVRLKDRKALKLLLANDADPNVEGKEGRTALHIAVEHTLSGFVDLLVKSGADINAHDDAGASPLWLAKNVTPFAAKANDSPRHSIRDGGPSPGRCRAPAKRRSRSSSARAR